VRYAIGLPNVGEFADIQTLVDLAVSAEEHGWHGVHLWDHILFHEPDWPVTSPVVAASAIAAATRRLEILLTLTLPRRQVQDVAQDTAAIDALSGRRLTVVAVLGSMEREYSEFGLDPDPRARGRLLDERLSRLTDLWQEWSVPRIPIWCGGRWPNKPGLRRAARFDGAMPTFAGQRAGPVPVDEVAQAAAFVRGLAPEYVDIAIEGASDGPSAAGHVAPYAAAGATWWVEAFGWWRGGPDVAASRITAGPPPPTPPGSG
jgi:alkanesulfonate monooxygenase SsuD/methylene tetrahydromethanopterin reductase-like flavin-dependent oxidoreductase (luciferase family)